MYSELYVDMPLVEAEQMQFDEDYQTYLSLEDIQRIDKLPPLISTAMPFLHSRQEVECHRLLNKYYRSLDDDHYRDKDARDPTLNIGPPHPLILHTLRSRPPPPSSFTPFILSTPYPPHPLCLISISPPTHPHLPTHHTHPSSPTTPTTPNHPPTTPNHPRRIQNAT